MDPISDMLTSIRNGIAVGKTTVSVPFSNLKYEFAKLLQREGFIYLVEKRGRGPKRMIEFVLKYNDGKPVISGLKRVSKPGQRIYKSYKEIKPVKSGLGIAVISTSKGLLTDREARKQRVGGEVICEVW